MAITQAQLKAAIAEQLVEFTARDYVTGQQLQDSVATAMMEQRSNLQRIAEDGKKLVERLEELLSRGDDAMKKQQEQQKELANTSGLAVEKIKELGGTYEDLSGKTTDL